MWKKILNLITLFICALLLISASMVDSIAQGEQATPTTTPIPIMTLPDWIIDPNAQIIVIEAYEEQESGTRHILINTTTADRFVIDLSYVDGVSWIRADDTIYMKLSRQSSSGADNSVGFDEFVDIQTGIVTRLALRDKNAPQEVLASNLNTLDNGAGFTVSMEVSSDIVPIDNRGNYNISTSLHLILTDTNTDTIIRDWSLRNGSIDQFSVQWLNNGEYLGVWYGARTSDGMVGHALIYDTDGRIPIDFRGIREVVWYTGENARILYTENLVSGRWLCWSEIRPSNTDCQQLHQWQIENEATIEAYDWSADGQSVILTYTADDHSRSGLCVLRTDSTQQDVCPLERIANNGRIVSTYLPSSSAIYGIYSYTIIPNSDDTQASLERGLCVMNRETLEAQCLTDDILPLDTVYNRHWWSPSQRYLSFSYTNQDDNGQDGLCIFDSVTGEVTCPIQAKDLMDGYIEIHSWSPDSKYIAIIYTAFGPMSDDKSFSRFGILDIENSIYRDGGFALFDHRLAERWRPPIE